MGRKKLERTVQYERIVERRLLSRVCLEDMQAKNFEKLVRLGIIKESK